MKHMTNAQIDEINELLVDHADALTAFFDEGMAYGARGVVKGMLLGGLVIVGIDVILFIRKNWKSNKEERS